MDPSPEFGPDVGNVISPPALSRFLDERRDSSAVTLADLNSHAWEMVRAESEFYMLTFDDGYLDNLTTLVPILERFNVPAAVFITTGFIEGLEPFEYAVSHMILDRDVLNQPDGAQQQLQSADQKSYHYELLRRRLKNAAPGKRARLLTELEALNGDPPPATRARYLMNWDEVAELSSHPLITIGAHSHTHPVLSRISPLKALDELRTSRSILEAKLRQRIDTLAYPYGSNNSAVRALARRVGFELAFSTADRAVSLQDLRRPLALPRLSLN